MAFIKEEDEKESSKMCLKLSEGTKLFYLKLTE